MPKTPPVNKARPTANVTEIFSLCLCLSSLLSLSLFSAPPLPFSSRVGAHRRAPRKKDRERRAEKLSLPLPPKPRRKSPSGDVDVCAAETKRHTDQTGRWISVQQWSGGGGGFAHCLLGPGPLVEQTHLSETSFLLLWGGYVREKEVEFGVDT